MMRRLEQRDERGWWQSQRKGYINNGETQRTNQPSQDQSAVKVTREGLCQGEGRKSMRSQKREPVLQWFLRSRLPCQRRRDWAGDDKTYSPVRSKNLISKNDNSFPLGHAIIVHVCLFSLVGCISKLLHETNDQHHDKYSFSLHSKSGRGDRANSMNKKGRRKIGS